MPNIIVRIPEGVFDQAGRQALAVGIHAAAKAVERWGDEARQELLTWIALEEVKAGYLFAGGRDPLGGAIPVIVQVYAPAGVIDAAGRADLVARLHAAIAGAKPASDARVVMTSVIIREVADGHWGASGRLWHLGDFARAAGYAHLQHLVPPTAPATSDGFGQSDAP